ncbi:MAG TPA: ABC transporter ATP-binding protein [Usitatibacter sp.]|nr:ABC transporter ATP-binding protein [Usitatibacter sp.]
MTAILRAERVTKRFGALTAVDGVTYAVHEHEVAGIFGSNGAGKTTFFNLLTGYFQPDEGAIFYRDQDITRMPTPGRVALGIVRTFQLTSTFDNLSVADNLALAHFRARGHASLWGLLTHRRAGLRRIDEVVRTLELFDLDTRRDREVMHLSLGEKRRLEIAMAMIAQPQVLLLDEPLAGLAESEIKSVLEVLRRHLATRTIVIVEHKISQVQDFVQRLIVMHEGRILAEGTYDECMRHPEVRRSYWQLTDEPVAAPGAA